MLRKAWENAVYQYQTLRQSFDRDTLEVVDNRMKEAREGKQTIHTFGAPMSGYAAIHVIKLDAEAQKKVLEECAKERAALVEKMEKRREKYGLKP